MPALRLELPTIQNWSCHNCSGCCRQHVIEITDEERQRIEKQRWTAADGIPDGQSVIQAFGGVFAANRYRLSHRPDGACVFLNDDGLCRIHAKFGEQAKPLACRVYPYAFHPRGESIAVSLRFRCPSVVRNLSTPVAAQSEALKRIARQVVPDSASKLPPPPIRGRQQLDWPDFLKFIAALDETIARMDVPLVVRLQRSLFWIGLVEQATFEKVRAARLTEFLEIVTQAASEQFETNPPAAAKPVRAAAMQFRMLVAQYARRDTGAEIKAGLRVRLRLLRWGLRFARGTGNVPPMQDGFRPVPFSQLEQPFGGLPDEAEQILTQYFRVKIQGIHFCGAAWYGVGLIEGFRSLVLMFPVVAWIARWLAAGDGRDRLQTDDIVRAITLADHHHGYSQVFGTIPARRRTALLAGLDAISNLCLWYNR